MTMAIEPAQVLCMLPSLCELMCVLILLSLEDAVSSEPSPLLLLSFSASSPA